MLTYDMELCNIHADLLSKYKDMFPKAFIDSIRAGVSWLCSHNGITYQTSTLIKTDKIVYSPDSGILKIGLIDVDRPLTGLSYYDVKKVTEAIDNVSGKTTFNVELNYKTPIGIKVVLIPFKYFDPKFKPELTFYTKDEMDTKIKELTDKIESIEIPTLPEPETVDLTTYIRMFSAGENYKANDKLFHIGVIYKVTVDVQNVQEADLEDKTRFEILYQPPVIEEPTQPVESIEIINSADFEQNKNSDDKVPSARAVNDKLTEITNLLTNEINAKADITELNSKADVTMLDEKANKTELDAKANIADVYTKQEADEKFELKTQTI